MTPKKSIFTAAEEFARKGKYTHAVKFYRRIIADSPGDHRVHHNFAILLRKLGQIEEAIEQSQIAYNLSPNNPTIVLSLGLSLERGGYFTEAENFYKKSLKLNPEYAFALNNLGHILEMMERPLEAFPILQKAHALYPNDNNISLNLSNVYLSLGKPKKAEALISKPITAGEYNTLGIARYVQRDWMGAKSLFQQALKNQPDFAGGHENLALALLQMKKLKEGWKEYEWRWKNSANQITKRVFDKPIWNGAALTGKTLLLHNEQGYGDTIQFIRYANLIKKGQGKVLLMCDPKLADLLVEVPGVDEVLMVGDKLPKYDFHAPLLSLPKLIKGLGDTFPIFNSYIAASGPIQKSGLRNKKFKIGICWKGQPKHIYDPHRNRSCPLNLLKILAQDSRIALYNLQVEPEPDLNRVGFNLIKPNQKVSTFKDTAEVINSLDLVVSVDTAVIHLTGAIGKPGIVMLNYTADWRWGNGNGIAPWYPAIKMFRQEAPGDWKPVIEKIFVYIKNTYLK